MTVTSSATLWRCEATKAEVEKKIPVIDMTGILVETTRLELVTSCMSSKRSNQLG